MNINQERNTESVFTPLTSRDATVSLAELQQYVSSAPRTARLNSNSIAIALTLLAVGTGLFFAFGNASKISTTAQQIPATAKPSIITETPVVAVKRALTSTVTTKKHFHLSHQPKHEITIPDLNAGLKEKPLLADMIIDKNQQLGLDCNDPSIFVVLAKIEIFDPKGYIN